MTRILATGQRVLLRHPTDADGDEFLAIVRRSRPLHRPWVFAPLTREDFLSYIRKGQGTTHERLLVIERATELIIGVINISEIVRGSFQSGYLGYYGSLPPRGEKRDGGLMTEALRLTLRYAFVKLKLHRLEANIQPRNAASIALVNRCGFRLEGVSPRYLKIGGRWRDHERWAITAEDWRGRVKRAS